MVLKSENIIKQTPKPAITIVMVVPLEIFSLIKTQAKRDVIKGIEAQMNNVDATVVVVIDWIRQIPAKASKLPAAKPGLPTS